MQNDPDATESGAGGTFVVVLGRTNYLRASGLVDSLIADMEAAGHRVRRFRPTEQWLDEQFSASRLASYCRRRPRAGAPVRQLAKLALLLREPSRWDYLVSFGDRRKGLPRCDRRRLSSMIRSANAGRVCLLAHSAGGIVATRTASDPCVTSLVCFGYPFKHPQRSDEAYRTAHLPSVAKPFLIIQGERDDYGSALDARRYPLSPSTTVVGVNAGHDYGVLEESEYQTCRDLVLRFVGGHTYTRCEPRHFFERSKNRLPPSAS